MVFADISNSNTSISKINVIIRTVDECAEISFSGRQNAENEHCETLKKLVHKLTFQRYTWIFKTLNVVLFVYYISSNQVYNEKVVVFADISNPDTSIYKIID